MKKRISDHKIAIERVGSNISALKNKPQTLRSVYDVIFSKPDFIYLNVLNGYGFDEITYDEADKRNRCYAFCFKMLINPSEKHVGLLLDNSKEWIYSFFGLLIGGFIPVLFSTSNTEKEIEYVVNKLNISTIVTNKNNDYLNKLHIINPFFVDVKNNNNQIDSLEKFENQIVFLSSGTTGMPKIVFYSGEQICNQLYDAKYLLKNEKGIDRAYKGEFKHLVVLPFFHVFGLITVLLWFSFFNITFVIPIDLNPKSIRQACLLTKPTYIFAVPLFWETIRKNVTLKCEDPKIRKKLDKALSTSYKIQKSFGYRGTAFVRNVLFKKYLDQIFGTSIRFCITGGSSIGKDTLRMINLFGYPLVNGYGSTEIGIVSLCNSNSIDDRLSTSIGTPFESVSFKKEGDRLFVLSKSSSTHFITEDDEVFLKEREWIDTADIVNVVNNKYYLFGRDDEIVVLSNGENISLAAIEKEIVIPSAKEFSFVKTDNNQIALVAVFDRFFNPGIAADQLKAALNHDFGKYISKVFYTNVELPKANSIKYKRFEIAKLIKSNKENYLTLEDLVDKGDLIKESSDNKLLSEVVDVFVKVLANNSVKPDSHFYNDLGGDSLRYFVLLAEIEKHFGIEIKIEDNSKAPYTPREIASIIGGMK